MQRQTRTNSRALSLSSEKRGKEVPSEADVVVIGKNLEIMLVKNIISNLLLPSENNGWERKTIAF